MSLRHCIPLHMSVKRHVVSLQCYKLKQLILDIIILEGPRVRRDCQLRCSSMTYRFSHVTNVACGASIYTKEPNSLNIV
jgi:hypothetical protein